MSNKQTQIITRDHMLSNRQLQALIIVDFLGVLMTTVTSSVTGISREGSWLYVFLGGVMIAVIMGVAVSSGYKYQGLMGTKIGKLFGFIIFFKILLCGGLWLRFFSETMSMLLLPKTAVYLISLLTIYVGFYTGAKGLETKGRLAEILIVLMFLVVLFVFLLSAKNLNIDNLQPIKLENSLEAIKYTVSMAFGVEFLFLVSPYVNSNKKTSSAIIAGLILAVVLGGIVAFTVGVFGVVGVIERRWAVLQIMDTIDFPLMLLERQDVILMGFWIITIFGFISSSVFYGGHILSKVVAKDEKSVVMFFVMAVAIFAVSFLPENLDDVTRLIEKAGIFNLIFNGLIVLVFIFLGRGKK